MERSQGLVAKRPEQELLRLAVGAAIAGEGNQLPREPLAQGAVARHAIGGELAPDFVHGALEHAQCFRGEAAAPRRVAHRLPKVFDILCSCSSTFTHKWFS